MKNTILIIDDEKDIRLLLTDYFSMKGYEVICASGGKEGIQTAKELKPDIILLDVNMPDIDGMGVCSAVRNEVDCPIVFLTARDSEQDLVHGLRIGGDDYITKPFQMRELSARIESHLRRDERLLKRKKERSEGVYIDYRSMTVSFNGEPIPFTKTEFDIIALLSRYKGQVFDRERIYEAIRGYDSQGDNTVITEHMRKIRRKFSDAGCDNCVETVWGVGYKWVK